MNQADFSAGAAAPNSATAALKEKEKMLRGELFDCMDPELTRARLRIRPLL